MLEGLGRTRQDLLNALLHEPVGMSIDELAQRLGVTRTAVRQHLAALERDGLVLRGATRPTGRRPEQLHLLTAHAREQFPRQYPLLAGMLIDEVAGLLGPEALAGLMAGLGRKLAADLEREAVGVERIVEHMNRSGYEAQLIYRSPAEPQIVAHNCVFHRLAQAHPVVCEFDLALIGALGGGVTEHLECMVRRGKVCRFVVNRGDAGGNASPIAAPQQ